MTTAGQPLARYAAFRRAGDFLFLSGVTPVDPARRRIVLGFADIPAEAADAIGRTGEFSVDIHQERILAQSWAVLEGVRSILQSAGAEMADVVRLVQYFRDLRDFPLYSRVRGTFFPEGPPASTVVEVSGLMPTRDVVIEVEATAYRPAGRAEPPA